MIDALGIIETVGFTSAVQAADAAVKSANVKLGKWIKVGGGRVCIVMRGEVAAVKAAVDAGVTAAKGIGNVACSLVIPRPSDKLAEQFPIEPLTSGKKGGK
ncbi:MAG: BMC domain-containing protein [Ignavibacteriales bacterium]|nr:BMC domain-containing protein [Ignavibacteriales bacterium]